MWKAEKPQEQSKVLPKVKRKQGSYWQVLHEPSKSFPVFMLKVVDSLTFDTKLFNKSSFIFLTNQFSPIKSSRLSSCPGTLVSAIKSCSLNEIPKPDVVFIHTETLHKVKKWLFSIVTTIF